MKIGAVILDIISLMAESLACARPGAVVGVKSLPGCTSFSRLQSLSLC